jgi:hypothetical protein
MAAISVVLVLEGIATLRDGKLGVAWRAVETTLLFSLAVVGSPLYPLLRFKSDERTLEIAPTGISTTIGRKSGQIAWGQVADIDSHAQRIFIIGKNGNSFIVPDAAFSNDAERTEFIELANRWLREAKAA